MYCLPKSPVFNGLHCSFHLLFQTAAAMLEDITRKSCHFLASTATTCTAIRLQKIVTSSHCRDSSSHLSNYSLSSSHPAYKAQDHQESKRKDLTECNGPGSTIYKTCEDKNGENGYDLNNRNISPQLDETCRLTRRMSVDKESTGLTVPAVCLESTQAKYYVDDNIKLMEYSTRDPSLQNKVLNVILVPAFHRDHNPSTSIFMIGV